jgi:hypothetical protein
MLKKRIKKWDLDRNHKHSDMLCALRLAFQREAQGKKTEFLIRGRVVTFDNVKKYFRRRKEVHDPQSLMTGESTAAPTTCIVCHTPEPDVTAGENAMYNAKSSTASNDPSLHHPNPTVMAVPDPDQVDPLMTLSGSLRQLDQLLHLGCNYFDSVFEDPDWRNNGEVFELRSLEMFYHHMFDGQSLLERSGSSVTEAFEHFKRAFDLIHHILRQQTFLFLPYLYHMMLPTRQIRRQEVFSKLLGFVFRMAQQCYPQLHPILRSLGLLRRMSIEDRGESSKRAFQSILNYLRVEFQADISDDFELLSSEICQARADSTLEQRHGNYKLTSVVVRKLAEDAELLEQLAGHEHTLPATLTATQVEVRHRDLKPGKILCFNDDGNRVEVEFIDLGSCHDWSASLF